MTGIQFVAIGPISSLALLCVLWPLLAGAEAAAPVRNGFAISGASVPVEEILPGGPARDGIPALLSPRVTSVRAAPWKDEERVIGIEIDGIARAYPIAILNWHELVNDTISGVPILVSYCPLCGTGMVFRREVAAGTLTFGVSGLLYRSDVLLYDRETESLWSQIASVAISGAAIGTRLELIRSRHSSWGRWRREYPETTVLSGNTGYRRDYTRSPYRGYAESDRLLFPVPSPVAADTRYPKKMLTLGIRSGDGRARAYPVSEVIAAGGLVRETLDGEEITITFSRESAEFKISAPARFEVIEGYWFAWLAFHPDSTVFTAGQPKGVVVAF
jgi:hypothetical protein